MQLQALLTLLLRVFGAAMTYVFFIAVARVVSVKDFGILGTLMSSSLLLSVLASMGQQLALVRFLPPLTAQNQCNDSAYLIKRSALLSIKGNSVLLIAMLAILFLIPAHLVPSSKGTILIGIIIIPLTAMVDFQAYIARSYRLVLLAILPKDIFWRFFALVVIGITWLTVGRRLLSLHQVFLILDISLGLIIMGNYYIMARYCGVPDIRQIMVSKQCHYNLSLWDASRVPLWIVSVASVAFINIDVMFAGILLGPKAAALYFAANRIAIAPNFYQQSYNIILGSHLSEAHALGHTDKLHDVAAKASLSVFVPTLVTAAAFAIIAPNILHLFGKHFSEASDILRLLLLSSIVNTFFGPADMMLNMCGHERVSMHIALQTLIGGIVLISGLTVAMGATGIALAVLLITFWKRWWYWNAASAKLGIRLDIVNTVIRFAKRGRAK